MMHTTIEAAAVVASIALGEAVHVASTYVRRVSLFGYAVGGRVLTALEAARALSGLLERVRLAARNAAATMALRGVTGGRLRVDALHVAGRVHAVTVRVCGLVGDAAAHARRVLRESLVQDGCYVTGMPERDGYGVMVTGAY